MRVGIFDSGVGGLTVLKSLVDRYKNNEYIYLGDTINIPYGNKSVDEIVYLANKMIDFLLKENVDIIIIACGTISSLVEKLKKVDKKVIDIISPTISYINKSNYNNIGVIATKSTIRSNAFNKINKNIKCVECPMLATLIENDNSDIDKYLSIYLNKLNNIDALILGCTHYKIISDKISKKLNVKLIDMSDFIKIEEGEKSSIKLYFTKIDNNVLSNVNKILKTNPDIKLVEL